MARYAPLCPICGWQGTVISEHPVTFPNPLGKGRISEEAHHLMERHFDPDRDKQGWTNMRYIPVEV